MNLNYIEHVHKSEILGCDIIVEIGFLFFSLSSLCLRLSEKAIHFVSPSYLSFLIAKTSLSCGGFDVKLFYSFYRNIT